MPTCRKRRCEEAVRSQDDLCLKHLIEFLDNIATPLHEDDLSYLIADHSGCYVSDLVVYLGVPPNIIGLFLEYKRGLKGYGEPQRFIEQPLLLLVLLYRDGLKEVNLALKSREESEATSDAIVIPKEKPRHQVELAKDEFFLADAAGKLGVSDSTVIKWVRMGLIPHTERATSGKGRMVKIFQLVDLIKFAQNVVNDPDFKLYHERFLTFLNRNKQTP